MQKKDKNATFNQSKVLQIITPFYIAERKLYPIFVEVVKNCTHFSRAEILQTPEIPAPLVCSHSLFEGARECRLSGTRAGRNFYWLKRSLQLVFKYLMGIFCICVFVCP
jgi:hypothetical protein